MKRMKLWALVATIIYSVATLTGCKKEIPNNNNNNSSNTIETSTLGDIDSLAELKKKMEEGGN